MTVSCLLTVTLSEWSLSVIQRVPPSIYTIPLCVTFFWKKISSVHKNGKAINEVQRET